MKLFSLVILCHKMESNSLSNNNENESFKIVFQLKEKIIMILF